MKTSVNFVNIVEIISISDLFSRRTATKKLGGNQMILLDDEASPEVICAKVA